MKDEIQQLKTKNIDIEERIKHVEEEIEDVSDDESDSEVDLSLVKAKLTNENSLKQKGQEIKCDKCDFVGETELFIKKHKNTKHPLQSIEEKASSTNVDCNLEGIEDIEDLFQREVLDGEQVYACNVCNHGFDMEDKIKKHIIKDHKEITTEISKDMKNNEETNFNNGH